MQDQRTMNLMPINILQTYSREHSKKNPALLSTLRQHTKTQMFICPHQNKTFCTDQYLKRKTRKEIGSQQSLSLRQLELHQMFQHYWRRVMFMFYCLRKQALTAGLCAIVCDVYFVLQILTASGLLMRMALYNYRGTLCLSLKMHSHQTHLQL